VRTLGHPHPALDLELFGARSFRWANIATAAFTIGFTAMFFAQVLFMTQVWHYGIVRTGLAMMPGPAVVMVLAPYLGRLAGRIGQRSLLVPGGIVYAASGIWFLATITVQPHWAREALPGSLLAGLGVSLVIPHLTSAAVQGLPPDQFGAGSAVNQAIRQFGATFGVALTVALLGSMTPLTALAHFHRVWWMLVICGVLTSVAALALPKARVALAPTVDIAPAPIGEAA